MNDLKGNDYNPNKVFTPELRLLRLSILEDGWTQPIVARRNGEIVDGFHRWTIASSDPDVRKMTGGKIPVVFIPDGVDRSHQMMSTIRHNRARGSHHVLKMASIVQELIDNHRLSEKDVMLRLGMDPEEVERLYDRGGMIERGSADGFNKAWVPSEKGN